jgi:3-oxoacyl-[acyl-carrier protein] reductase
MADSKKRLSGRVALITGGSRGIGRTTAEMFAREGAHVAIVDIDEEAGRKAEKALGPEHRFFRLDVTDLAACQAVATEVADAFGSIDILINNAGITRDATLLKMQEADFDAVVSVNLKGVFNMTKAVAPFMVERGWGRILNASSVVGLYGNFGQTNYVATKAGVIGMTQTWARELGRKGVTVNAVAPGFIATEMIDTVPEKVIEQLTARTPLQRLGRPEDIAAAYVFLASEEASFITGTVLSVDGGLVM